MNVTHLNTFTEGGAAEAALRLHNALLNENIKSKFLALYKGSCTEKEVYDFRDEISFFNYWLSKLINKTKSGAALRISKASGEWYSKLDSVWKAEEHSLVKSADTVHLHWVSNYVNIPSFLNTNKKIVWTLHDHFLFSGGFHYPPPVKKTVMSAKIEADKQAIKVLLEKHPIDIVCPSENLMQLAKDSGILNKCRFHVIKNVVGSDFKPLAQEPCRQQLNIPAKGKVLFFLSDLLNYERKGFSVLMKALALMNEEITLIVAGKGDLPAKIGKVTIQHFGLVRDKSKLNQLYNASDLLVNPSLNDISSNTIIEAMACGKPSVAFNSGGIPELITNVNGLITKEKTAESLAETIQKALEINFDANAIVEKSKAEHSASVIAKKYIEVYGKISS